MGIVISRMAIPCLTVQGERSPGQGLSGGAHGDQLSLFIDTVSDYAIFLLDAEGNIVSWNRGAERIKGWTADEIIGQHFSTFYTAPDRERGHPQDELRIARRDGRYEEEGWRVRKDGSRFWANVVITALRDETGELRGFGKVTRGLTGRLLSEEQLRHSVSELQQANEELEQFRRLVASVRDYAIFMLDPGGHIATWNVGAQHIKGYQAEEIIGRHFSTFYTQVDRDRHHPQAELEIAAREGRYEEEGWRVRKDGTTFWASVTITAVRNESGTLVGYAKVTRDLTERREAEESLRFANEQLKRSNEELDRFAAVAAHDLSDPLRTIEGFADLLSRETLSEPGREFLGHITSTAERMQRLLANLLDYAKADEPASKSEPVALAPAADAVVASLAASVSERDAKVSVGIPADAVVLAAPGDVDILLQNLISNALKFGSAQGPRVDVAAERDELGWCIRVTDNGVGIQPADQERIFAAFQRAHPELGREGTGLGLAICERIARRYGGSIGLRSAPGQGSTFWVSLPPAVTTP
jgi:PAS domain S-box-containing protein